MRDSSDCPHPHHVLASLAFLQAAAAAPIQPASSPVAARRIGSSRLTSDQMWRRAEAMKPSQYEPSLRPSPPPMMTASGSRTLTSKPRFAPSASPAESTTAIASASPDEAATCTSQALLARGRLVLYTAPRAV